jgi:hypothetical protein
MELSRWLCHTSMLFDDSLSQSLTNDGVGEADFVELFFLKYFMKFSQILISRASLSSRTVLIDLSMSNLVRTASSKI